MAAYVKMPLSVTFSSVKLNLLSDMVNQPEVEVPGVLRVGAVGTVNASF
jgi:hypothetical protein